LGRLGAVVAEGVRVVREGVWEGPWWRVLGWSVRASGRVVVKGVGVLCEGVWEGRGGGCWGVCEGYLGRCEGSLRRS
jgi:hypothetical protein